MTQKLTATPERLLALACLGGVISVIGFYAVGKSHDSLPFLLVYAVLVLGGMFLIYWAPYHLREGIRNERWPAEQTAPLRRIVEHAAWTAAIFVLVIAMLLALALQRHHNKTYFWPVFLLLQTMTQLSGAFRAPRPRPDSPNHVDWATVQPLHSDHWGER